MRRTLTILFALALTALTAKAQVGDPRNMLSLGFNAGMGTSRVSFVPRIKQSTCLGPTFGVSLRHISEKYFFLICGTQLECNFARRGWTENIEDGSGNEYIDKNGNLLGDGEHERYIVNIAKFMSKI